MPQNLPMTRTFEMARKPAYYSMTFGLLKVATSRITTCIIVIFEFSTPNILLLTLNLKIIFEIKAELKWIRMTESHKNAASEKNSTNDSEDQNYGFQFYPERRAKEPKTLYDNFWDSFSSVLKQRKICEVNVARVVKQNPLVKVLLGALEKAGCPVDISRHIVCEPCDNRVTGGYDTEYNQIVICQNHSKPRTHPEVVLIHELIHMFDYCTGEVDFKNLDHLACTEIRAANIAHCSFLSSFLLGQSSFINIKKTHQFCVKMKAIQTIQLTRNIDFDTALLHVLKVFDKCYNDLEPVGRRPRRGSADSEMIYNEAKYYGKCDL